MNHKQGVTVAKEHNSGAADTSSSATGLADGTGNTGAVAGSADKSSSGTGDDPVECPHCGRSSRTSGDPDHFLARLGITAEMIDDLKSQFETADIDEYLNAAREYLKDGSSKARTYAKENPGKIAAGVAALALGAGLIWSKCHTAQDVEDRSRQLELKRALRGRKYRLDEVMRELDVNV